MIQKEEEQAWQVVSSEYLHHDPWLTVRRDHVVLPNGRHIPSFYVLEYPEWVNTLAITREGHFVFVRQYRYGIGETSYELCAGVCEESDPSPLYAAKRELLEETGYGGGQWREYMQLSANATSMNNITHCFLATDVEPVSNQSLDPTECLTVQLFTFDEVSQLLREGGVKQALMAAPLWKYMAEVAQNRTR